MRITISGKNIELTEGLKQAVEEKLSKLEKFFKPDTDVYVTLSVERIDKNRGYYPGKGTCYPFRAGQQ